MPTEVGTTTRENALKATETRGGGKVPSGQREKMKREKNKGEKGPECVNTKLKVKKGLAITGNRIKERGRQEKESKNSPGRL